MEIDYEALLKDPKVRRALGKRKYIEAVEDPEYLANIIAEEGRQVLCLEWDGGSAGNTGAIWISEWNGFYFFESSDYDAEGPMTLEDALGDERFWIETPNPELSSKVIPKSKLLRMGAALAGEEGNTVTINHDVYVLLGGELVLQKGAKS